MIQLQLILLLIQDPGRTDQAVLGDFIADGTQGETIVMLTIIPNDIAATIVSHKITSCSMHMVNLLRTGNYGFGFDLLGSILSYVYNKYNHYPRIKTTKFHAVNC